MATENGTFSCDPNVILEICMLNFSDTQQF